MVSHDNRASARVDISVGAGGSFTIELSDVRNTRHGELDVVMTTNKFTYGQSCFDAGARTDIGTLTRQTAQTFPLLPDFATADPSYLHSLILSAGTPDNTKCLGNAVGAANLTWTIPNMRPDLHAVDQGAQPGATGTTTLTGGQLTTYTSAKGDEVAAIAKRFGLAVPDLLYLNPNALEDAGGLAIIPGTRVNLATATR